MKIKNIKKWILEKHHFLILLSLFLVLVVLAFFLNSDNLGLNFEEKTPSSQDSSVEKSLEEKPSYPPPVPSSKNLPPSQKNMPGEIKPVDYSNFISNLLANEMISSIPKNGVLSLTTFNFNSGEREIEKTFILKKDLAYEGSESADIYINVHSKYVTQLNTNNLCDVLKRANANGDFGAWSELEDSSLVWKYKSMLKYRDCLGL